MARATDPLPSPPRIRVVVYLDPDAIEDLELIRRYRHGPQSRSEVVRQAVTWLRAKEAAWLLGAHRNQERRRREAEALALIQAQGREAWEKQTLDVMCTQATNIAREGLTKRVG